MASVQEPQVNGKTPDTTVLVAEDIATTSNGRRGFDFATAEVSVALCFRSTSDVAEAEGWIAHLLGEDSSELLVRSVAGDVDVARLSRAGAAELFGANVGLLETPKPKRCGCGAPRDRGRRLCGTCRLERLRERDARSAVARNGKSAATAPIPGQLTLFETP